ncbi:MAG: hypothetical protein F2663_04665 [Actinobacteria bacterium]|uniref:Unannotated protein n=1 Tax=freshwater metagenome TaxID=449393 RepID=A0A6J6P791_9ZZZZ|nr:hypothetical protein [Actinomycetota bacterium]
MLVALSTGDVANIALAIFLLAVGLGLGYSFFRLAGAFGRLASLIRGTERELLPVINKVGGSVDRVNVQLDKLDEATDSALDAVEAVDSAVRTVSFAVKRPIQKATGFTAGVSHGFATLRTKRNVKSAMASAKEAATRREADLEEELRRSRD